jgi:NAD-dependent DNA ligase
MHQNAEDYFRFTGKSRLEKSINSLLGLIEGIAIDGQINPKEIALLGMWLEDHRDLRERHPYSELIPVVEETLSDGILDTEERADLTWLCERMRSTEFFSKVTADLQRLHALVGGIAADGVVTEKELRGLSEWLDDHSHLRTCWPYDEVGSLTSKVLADGRIDDKEQKLLHHFFSEFLAVLDERTIVSPILSEGPDSTVGALCAVMPEITFPGSTFCFTGSSTKLKRKEFEDLVRKLGGEPHSGVTAKLHFLVIGAEGNPCWAFACYGRKVEKAVELRKKGVRVMLVHENDFHDAVMDA